MEDRLIKITTVMKYIEMSKSKIYDYMEKGLFPQKHNIGSSSLWFMSDIQEYIRNQKNIKNKKVA